MPLPLRCTWQVSNMAVQQCCTHSALLAGWQLGLLNTPTSLTAPACWFSTAGTVTSLPQLVLALQLHLAAGAFGRMLCHTVSLTTACCHVHTHHNDMYI